MILARWMDAVAMSNKALAKYCGVTEEAARLWRQGLRRPSEEHARRIARLSKNMVTVLELRGK